MKQMNADPFKIPDPIYWSQGMLLTPRHFLELGGRYEMMQQRMATIQPFSWGVLRLRYDQTSLAKGVIDITELEAVMPDGTLVQASEGEIAPFTVEKAASGDVRSVCLTLPSQPRFACGGVAARYRVINQGKSGEAGHLRPILNLTGETTSSLFVSLPLFRLAFRTEFSNEYEPPWLSVPESSSLTRICAGVVELLRSKIGFLTAQIRNPTQSLTGIAELRDKLLSLISGLPVLEAYLKAGRVSSQQSPGLGHPFPLYIALCAIAGHVSLMGSDLAPPEFDAYDHTDLLACFSRVADFIVRSVNQGISQHWAPFQMSRVNGGFELTPTEAIARYQYSEMPWPSVVIGLRVGPGQTKQSVVEWASRCLIATGDATVNRENRVIGARRTEWADPPDLTAPPGVVLVAIDKGDRSLDFSEKLHLAGDAPLPAEALLYLRATATAQKSARA